MDLYRLNRRIPFGLERRKHMATRSEGSATNTKSAVEMSTYAVRAVSYCGLSTPLTFS